MKKIFLFEGPDCVGKTSIINEIIHELVEAKKNIVYIHNGVYPSMNVAINAYIAQLFNAESFDGITLFDRGILSEMIYGKILRNTTVDPEFVSRYIKQLNTNGCIILCNLELGVAEANFRKLKNREHLKDVESYRQIHEAFVRLYDERNKVLSGIEVKTFNYLRNFPNSALEVIK